VSGRGLAYMTRDADAITPFDQLPGRDQRWLQRACGVALTSTHTQRMGAIAVRGGNPIHAAVNRFRNHPRVVVEWADGSVHAEAAVIESCDAAGSIVYVARITTGGNTAIAKPCRACLLLLTTAAVKRVVWTEDNDAVGIMSLG
jgi:deoxycytidylate deaminase